MEYSSMVTGIYRCDMVVKPMESNTSSSAKSVVKATDSSLESCRPQKERVQLVLKCPRCNSSNTKFCYYNNYSLSQPRYFCKTCRRYWTEGGSLRNIPVGGSSRKNNKRSSSSSSNSSCIVSQSSSKKLLFPAAADHDSLQNPNIKVHDHECQDLNLGFYESNISNDFKTISQLIQVPNFDINNIGNDNNKKKKMQIISPNNSSSTTSHDLSSALEQLSGIQSSRGFINGSFKPMLPSFISTDHENPNTTLYSSTLSSSSSAGFPLRTDHQFIKPIISSTALSFSLDNELGSSTIASNGRLSFPFEDLKVQASKNITTPTTTNHDSLEQQHNVRSEGFRNGMLGSGGSW